jgi:hypothetical protein
VLWAGREGGELHRLLLILVLAVFTSNCRTQQCPAELTGTIVFRLIHSGGWQRYPVAEMSLTDGGTLRAKSDYTGEIRCASLSDTDVNLLKHELNGVLRAGLGSPRVSDDSRTIRLLVGSRQIDANYRATLLTLTPEGVKLITHLDHLAQHALRGFYCHTLTLPATRRPVHCIPFYYLFHPPRL